MNRRRCFFAGWLCALLILLAGCKDMTVGTNIPLQDIHEFTYTFSSSVNPPKYQHYRFYTESNRYLFYHEAREGDHWPLTEDDITLSGTKELTEAQWSAFLRCLEGGTAARPEVSTETGDAGPWLYLYRAGDSGNALQFRFSSYGARTAFEDMCGTLSAQ